MKEVVSHMPLSPRANPEVGYYGIHTQAHIISNLTGNSYVFTANNLGSKVSSDRSVQIPLRFLEKLGINPDLKWTDDQETSLCFVKDLIIQGINKGWIVDEEQETFLCPCGMTEFLNRSENLYENQERTTYKVSSGSVKCRECGQEATLATRSCLVMKMPGEVDIPHLDIYPPYAEAEIRHFFKIFRGKDYLVSRSTPKPASVCLEEKQYWVDIDLCWIPFIAHFQQNLGLQVDVLLTGNRTLKQVALSLLVGKLLEAHLPSTIVATPYIDVDFGKKPHLGADEFLAQNGPQPICVFLGQTLGSDRKSLVLPSRSVYWIAKTLQNLPTNQIPGSEKPPLGNFLNKRNYDLLIKTMKKLRSGNYDKLDNYEKWLLRAILN